MEAPLSIVRRSVARSSPFCWPGDASSREAHGDVLVTFGGVFPRGGLNGEPVPLLRSIGWLRYGGEAVAGGRDYGGLKHSSLLTPTALGGAHENSDDHCSWFRRWHRWSDSEYRQDTIDRGSAERAAIERTNSA